MPEKVIWPSPTHQINAALRGAAEGRIPDFTPEELLATLGLDEVPDDRSLLDRFVGGQEEVGMLRDILALQGNIAGLVELSNNHETNDAQEAVMRALGAAVVAQVATNGEICVAVLSIVASSTRDDIIAPEVRAQLGVDDPKLRSSATARLRRLRGFATFLPGEDGTSG
jgi:hypothetical protein